MKLGSMEPCDLPDLLAVDGGGSKCRAALVIDGVIARQEAGPSNLFSDPEGAAHTIGVLIEQTAKNHGKSLIDIEKIPGFLAIAGAIFPDKQDSFLKQMGLRNCVLRDDRASTVWGALAEQDGWVASLGTGSFFARKVTGKVTAIGGWGAQFGDAGSGAWLGTNLLRRAFEFVDGTGAGSPMISKLIDHHDGPAGLLAAYADAGTSDIAALAELIFQQAQAGDAAATALVDQTIAETRRALSALGWQEGQALCLTGGVGLALSAYAKDAFGGRILRPEGTALDGAIAIASQISLGKWAEFQ